MAQVYPKREEDQDNTGERASYSRNCQDQGPVDRTQPHSPTKAPGKASYGRTKGQGMLMGLVQGQDLVGQRTIYRKRRQWQRAVDSLDPDTKPETDTENYVHPQYLLRDI